MQYKKYEKPFKVSKDCVITADAVSDTTNQSELETLEMKFKNGSEPETVKLAKLDFAKTSFVYNGKVQRPTGGDKIQCCLCRDYLYTEMSIRDNGIGIFRNICKYFHDKKIPMKEEQAAMELYKGKLTTDATGHYTGAHKTVILKITTGASAMQGWQRNNGYPVSAGYPLFFCRYEKQ